MRAQSVQKIPTIATGRSDPMRLVAVNVGPSRRRWTFSVREADVPERELKLNGGIWYYDLPPEGADWFSHYL